MKQKAGELAGDKKLIKERLERMNEQQSRTGPSVVYLDERHLAL